MSITGYALKKYTTVFVMVAFLAVFGIISYVSLPREAAPDVKIPYIFISTVYPGVSPSDIEMLVTRELEKELRNVKDIREITSSSAESFSIVVVEFDPAVDLDFALQRVKERVDAAKTRLPSDVEDPVVTEIDFDMIPIMNVVLTADYDLVRLKNVADHLADRFETIPGVLEAQITGDLEREVQINVDPARLNSYNLSMYDVSGAITNEDVTIPGGSIEIDDFIYGIRTPGEIRDTRDFRDLVVTSGPGGTVYVRDVAEVEYGFKDPVSIARLNGRPSISISITKRAGENIIHIADRIKEILETESPNFPQGTYYTILTDQSKFIRILVEDLENNIFSGFVLVMLCIFIFLGLTNSLFVAISIPLSMLITFIVLSMLDITLNFIVLFSLILTLGMLVDNAIVIVENIYRHRNQGKTAFRGTEEATTEVAMAITASTLTTVLAFAPLLFWPGIVGEFMKYLPITVIVVLSSSLFVALVINPVFCYRFMKVDIDSGGTPYDLSGWYDRVLGKYCGLLNKAVTYPKRTVGIAVLTLVATFAVYSFFGRGIEFFPETDPDAMWIDIEGPVGLKLDATDRFARQLENTARNFPDVTNILTNVGVSTNIFGSGGNTNTGRIYIDFKDFDDRSRSSMETFLDSKPKVEYITGARVTLNKELMGPPVGPPVAIQISGDDFLVLGDIAREIRGLISDIPGIVDLRDDFVSSKPEIRVDVDREKAAILGISTSQAAMAVRNAFSGIPAGKFRVLEDDYDITVRFAEEERRSLNDLDKVFILHEGSQIPLSSVASFGTAAGFGSITRVDMRRVVTVTANNYDRLPAAILADVRNTLRDYNLPEGYSINYRGQDEESRDAQDFLGKALLVALFLIFMVLVSQFNSVKLPFIILTSVILSLIGVFWGLIIMRLPFGIIMTGVGVISLAGVVVNNAIVLIDYTEKLRKRGKTKIEAILEGGQTRFRPVILTAITTIVGLIPLATGWSFNLHTFRFTAGGASSQWWAPMATAIIFGLAAATVLTLVIVPSLYSILAKETIEDPE